MDDKNKTDPERTGDDSDGGQAAGGEVRVTPQRIREILESWRTGTAQAESVEEDDALAAKGELEPSAGGEEPKSRRKPRKPQSGLSVQGGRREMKAYTVTEDQLESLGTVQLSTTLCFSLASGLLTFWIGVKQDVAFAITAAGPARSWWEGLATGALVASILMAILGLLQFWKGRSTIGKIKKDTVHD